MKNTVVARNYAEALLVLAQKANAVERCGELNAFHDIRFQPEAFSDQSCVSCDADDPEAVLVRMKLRQIGGQHDGLTLAGAHLADRCANFIL